MERQESAESPQFTRNTETNANRFKPSTLVERPIMSRAEVGYLGERGRRRKEGFGESRGLALLVLAWLRKERAGREIDLYRDAMTGSATGLRRDSRA